MAAHVTLPARSPLTQLLLLRDLLPYYDNMFTKQTISILIKLDVSALSWIANLDTRSAMSLLA